MNNIYKKCTFLLTLLCFVIGLQANAHNKLIIPDVVIGQGGTIALPVNLENDDPVVAVQFRLTLPEGFYFDENSSQLTNRRADHVMQFEWVDDNEYMCMVYSPSNAALNGNRGTMLYLTLSAPSQAIVNSEHTLQLTDAVASNEAMENVLDESSAGTVTIAQGIDLVPVDVNTDAVHYHPGDHLVLSWNVENKGQMATNGGWSEHLSLTDADGNVCSLGSLDYDGTLSGNSSISRQAEVVIPNLHGLSDNIRAQVTVLPYVECGERPETRANNTVYSDELILDDILYLDVPQATYLEGSAQAIKCRITRSGRWNEPLSVVVNGNDSRLDIPSPVIIPAEQSGLNFYVTIGNNSVIDNSDQAIITAIAQGYDEVSAILHIEDDEVPSLMADASMRELSEGESFTITVTTEKAPHSNLTIDVVCSLPSRFDYPKTVTIPAGENMATFVVSAVDDNIPDVDQEVTFAIAAERYQSDEVWVTLHDNDVPDVELTLTPSTISEIAGPNAILATLKRLNHIDNAITFILSDDSNGLLRYGNSQISMAEGVSEVQFAIGVNDNDVVDGDRLVNVTAAIYIKSCSCQAQGGQAGSVTRQLTVTDNDGPAITISSSRSTIAEGAATTLTISRNANLNQPLTVYLSSDDDTGLTYDHQVTIPAGNKSITLQLVVAANGQANDSRIVTLNAVAEGYSTGTCWLMISNQTLPDAQVADFEISTDAVEINGQVTATVTVTNTGSFVLPSQLRTVVYMNDGTELCRMFTQTALEPGATEVLTKAFIAPERIGTHEVYAVVNDGLRIQELITGNNTSERLSLAINAPFSTSLTVEKPIYQIGETITLNGTVMGQNLTADTQVEIYIINNGYRQTLAATTDANGRFSAQFTPYSAQMGHFTAGACYPGENSKEAMTSFDIVGLRRTHNGYIACDVLLNEPYSVEIGIENPSQVNLHNVHVNVLSQPENYDISFDEVGTLSGGNKATATVQIIGRAITAKNEWEKAQIEITSDEGARIELSLFLYCRNPQAQLKADVTTINTTMIKGQSRDYPFYISNIGKGNTGKITLSLPDWMTTATPSTMASLSQNESAQIVLRLTPTDDMPLNVPRTGSIAINCENGNGLSIPYRIEPVSETTGTLIVDVCDEYTYNTASAPHVQGATVKVKHPTTGAIVMEGSTDANGIFRATLPEGYYTLYVTADKHDSYANNILIDPGRENMKTVNLSFQAIAITWDVEETEVEDVYNIVTNYTYETNVPVPVVVISGPNRVDGDAMAVGESQLLYYTLTNYGLVDALEVEFLLPGASDEWSIRALAFTQPFTLSAKQSILIPVLLTRLSEGTKLRSVKDTFDACMAGMEARYKHFCGDELKENSSAYSLAVKACGYAATMSGLLSGISGTNMGGIGSGNPSDGPGTPPNPSPNPNNNQNHTGDNNGEPVIDIDRSICNPLAAKCYDWLLPKLLALLNQQSAVLGAIADLMAQINGIYTANKESLQKDALRELLKRLSDLYAQYEELREAIEELNKLLACIKLALPDFPDFPFIPELPDLLDSPLIQKYFGSHKMFNSMNDGSTGTDWIDYFNANFLLYCAQSAYVNKVVEEFMGDSAWFGEEDETVISFLEYASTLNLDDFTYDNLIDYKPESISNEQLAVFVNRLRNSFGEIDATQPHINDDKLLNDFEQFFECENIAHNKGFSTMFEMFVAALNELKEHMDEESNSVCSSISLQFSQQMVMTRQAFRGTLKVYNGHDSIAMQDVKLLLTVTDENGKLATSHEFQINPEKLIGFDGELSLDSGWSLDAGENGVATVLFIPTKYAAPTVAVPYTFAGVLSYIDPFTGELVTRTLIPQTLTVSPSPDLELDYFMQRDVFGDDPLTDEVEPMVPAEFALLINNKGYGNATNVALTTAQPEITGNKKGLSIDFTLLDGKEHDMYFGDLVNVFDTIAAQSQTYAQWWLTSSLTGHFTSYDVSYTHATSYGNADLSLIDTVRIHELIHGFTAGMNGEKPLRGFLVNDLPDANDLPDLIHFTNATQASAAMSVATISRVSDTDWLLTVTAGIPGWNYGSVLDPTHGRLSIAKVVRQSDGMVLNADNVWATDRTLRDAGDPLYENRLHYIVDITGVAESYLLTFEPRTDLTLEVQSFGNVPDQVLTEPLKAITVTFNKPIDESSFTTDDITLTCQGINVDASDIKIQSMSETTYKLDLSSVTAADGYYVLTVRSADIIDKEGYNGSTGKSVTWVQFDGGMVPLYIAIEPANAGIVLPESGEFFFNSILHLIAQPSPGYSFMYWIDDEGNIISNSPEFDFPLINASIITAVFEPLRYHVSLVCDPEQGIVSGAATEQICDYGTQLVLSAMPVEGYEFVDWRINGKRQNQNAEWVVVVDRDMIIEALFKLADAPDVTYPPIISTELNNTEVIITATGDGEILLYVNGMLVDNPYKIPRSKEDVTVIVTATAQESGKPISETVTIEIIIPKLSSDGIDELFKDNDVVSVRYFNINGQEINGINGLTILVITYTDGSIRTMKVMH